MLLVGAGRWGAVHARTLRKVGAVLAGIVDVKREAAERVARLYGSPDTRIYMSLDDALSMREAFDAAIVAVPPGSLYEVSKQVIEAGLHVLIEKPVAMKSLEAEELAQLAERKGIVALPGYLLRYHPVTRRAMRAIHVMDPWRMEVAHIVDRRGSARTWPIAHDIAVHDVDLVLFLLGGEPRVEKAELSVRETGSTLTIWLRTGDREAIVTASDEVGGCVKHRVLRIYGRGGVLEADYDANTVLLKTLEGTRVEALSSKPPLTLEHEVFMSKVLRALGKSTAKHPLEHVAPTMGDAVRVLRVIEEALRVASG
ncbi:oxidoreductase domain protein [Pyrolobus fumarii 1A]|uniref:Oxidoreductase domain protein n=1 Tax=Pyrolobus fumarii (strain DSM 11204 / 1A) TaxID=694429 RepID=G0ECV6_PYRF1|nr:oxidoreductase domain protein [Pyrolobus fumarii 1A]